MPLALTGISNDNEFYSQHYLSAILEGDIKNSISKWKEEAELRQTKPPSEKLRALSSDYFRFKVLFERERDNYSKVQLQREFLRSFFDALGYDVAPFTHLIDDEIQIPLLESIKNRSGAPALWIIEVFNPATEDTPLLSLPLHRAQFPDSTSNEELDLESSIEDLVTNNIFDLDEPPRWLIVASGTYVLLLDRTKWSEQRLLDFNLDEIFSEKDTSTFHATAVLLHKESMCPDDGSALLDTLDENSHKHAHAVSKDLKYALRSAIERLGNEVVYSWKNDRREKIYEGELDAGALTVECLRFMYRLLFILYVEAHPELGYAPMKSDAYRTGYSFESLRDLEMIPLTTDDARNGYFIHDSLKLLFKHIYDGYPVNQSEQLTLVEHSQFNEFTLRPLKCHLFDPARTPIINRMKLRNSVMKEIIELLSLSFVSRKEGRGRISYSQLGVNQLGEVYEALLSFRGFFAEEDLYEVQPAPKKSKANVDNSEEDEDELAGEDDNEVLEDSVDTKSKGQSRGRQNNLKNRKTRNELQIGYFVNKRDLEQYSAEERVFNADGTPRIYPKGTFVYRIAGRDRQKSASYYTPEVLTRSLVKYSLNEALEGRTADEILKLQICEPAMGSAAFLNEMVDQLAEEYLKRKQKELDLRIPHDNYVIEKQKVKMFLADRNVHGVDLNPIAVELAAVSMWLNCIFGDDGGNVFIPWFGLQLICGNSLIGARKAVYEREAFSKRSIDSFHKRPSTRVEVSEPRQKGSIYHFLVCDPSMAKYADPVVKKLAKEAIESIERWRAQFTQSYSAEDLDTLERLSDGIDGLWKAHAEQLRSVRGQTTDCLTLFGHEQGEDAVTTTTTAKDELVSRQILPGADQLASSAYQRLKLVMDYWCALWCWPLDQVDLLPSRHEFLMELSMLIDGSELTVRGRSGSRIGTVNINSLLDKLPRLRLVERLSERYRFLHWELEYADLFADRGGFDVVIGNPPWVKLGWEESAILGDESPLYAIRNYGSREIVDGLRTNLLENSRVRKRYFTEYEEIASVQNFLGAPQNYALLQGVKTNLYKCFVCQSQYICNKAGVFALIHEDGIFDDAGGGALRAAIYPRLRRHFQFHNERKLFPVDHHKIFSLNVYCNKETAGFDSIFNLFHPASIDACYAHDGKGEIPGIKDDNGKWNLNGHLERIVHLGPDDLVLFAKLYDADGIPANEARLLALHGQPLLSILKTLSNQERKLSHLCDYVHTSYMWDETKAQEKGILAKKTEFPKQPEHLVLSGPHFFVANAFHKSPKPVCRNNNDYDLVDTEFLSADYRPRTNFVPRPEITEYIKLASRLPWNGESMLDSYRLIARTMIGATSARSLIAAIIPPKYSHLNLGLSFAFADNNLLLRCASMFFSLPYDYFVKCMAKGHFYEEQAMQLPVLPDGLWSTPAYLRVLLLSCLTSDFSQLWKSSWQIEFRNDSWTKTDPRLETFLFEKLSPEWSQRTPLRTAFTRRQAALELDVLVAMALGLSLSDLIAVYKIQFPVFRLYEQGTYYDANGRIAMSPNKTYRDSTFNSQEWRLIDPKRAAVFEKQFMDDTLPNGPLLRKFELCGPFDCLDRELDYRAAWDAFSMRLRTDALGGSA